MASKILEIRIKDAASWKLKILQTVIKFLNWIDFPSLDKSKQTVVITVHFDIATIVTPSQE